MAERGEFDVLKVSYAALPWVLDELRAAALRRRAGPRLRPAGADADGIDATATCAGATVAVPSERSTAYLLFRLWAAERRAGRRDRGDAVPRDHAGRAGRPGRRRTGHPRGAVHLPELRPARAGRPRRVVGADTGLPIPLGAIIARRGLERRRAGRRHPGLGRVRLGRPGGLPATWSSTPRRWTRPCRPAHRALRQRVHPRPRRGRLRGGATTAGPGAPTAGLVPPTSVREPRLRRADAGSRLTPLSWSATARSSPATFAPVCLVRVPAPAQRVGRPRPAA